MCKYIWYVFVCVVDVYNANMQVCVVRTCLSVRVFLIKTRREKGGLVLIIYMCVCTCLN